MSRRVLGLALLGMSMLAGCDTGDFGSLLPGSQVSSEPLSGTIDGTAWSYVAGATDPAAAPADPTRATLLFGQPYAGCGAEAPVVSHLEVEVPTQVGDYPFSSSVNGTFVVESAAGGPEERHVTFVGRIIVDSVTPSAVTARLHMLAGSTGADEVNGSFTATICP